MLQFLKHANLKKSDHFQSTFFTDIWQILSIKIKIRERLLWLIFGGKYFILLDKNVKEINKTHNIGCNKQLLLNVYRIK